MESSLSGHRCGADHEVSDDKVSEWNWQRGLIRARVSKEIISVSACVYMPCLVLKCILYTYPFLLAIPYLSWHKCLICNASGLIQCRL